MYIWRGNSENHSKTLIKQLINDVHTASVNHIGSTYGDRLSRHLSPS